MRNLLRVIHIGFLLISCNERAVTSLNVFRFNMETPLHSIDPAFARDQFNVWACSQFFNGLVQLDSAMNVQPALAIRWEVEDGGKLYRFFLRNGVKFHKDACFSSENERLVSSADFLYSYQRLIDPATASPGAWIFNDKIDGPHSFSAPNDSVFEIRLNKAFPPFLGLLSMPYCFVVPKQAVDFYGSSFRSHPVGTGPFRFKFWEEGIKLLAEKNNEYFEEEQGAQMPYIDGFEVSFVENKQTAFMQFVQGKLDFFNGLEGSYKDELLTRQGTLREKYADAFQLRVGPYLNTEYFGFMIDPSVKNEKDNPLLNKDLRKSLSFAVNREEMLRYLRNNIGIPGNGGFIPEGLPGHSASHFYAYDADSARFYLKKSGYEKSSPELVLYTTKTYLDLTVYIQRMWEAIGVKSRIEVNQGPFHREMISQSRLNCFRASWLADYPDAENYLALFYSPNLVPSGPNSTHFKSTSFDALYVKSLQENDPKKRMAIYQEMDRLVMEEAPVLVLFYDQTMQLLSNRIERLPVNAMNHLSLKQLRFYASVQ